MRSLIDVQFIDQSSYSNNSYSDIVGMVMPHPWGPVNSLNSFDFSTFNRYYPYADSAAYYLAHSCFSAGAGLMEIFNPQGNKTYQHFILFTGRKDEAASISYTDLDTAIKATTDTGFDSFDEALTSVEYSRQAKLSLIESVNKAAQALAETITPTAATVTGTLTGVAIPTSENAYGYTIAGTANPNKLVVSGCIPYIVEGEGAAAIAGNYIGLKFAAPESATDLDKFSANINGKLYGVDDLEGTDSKYFEVWLVASNTRVWNIDINWGDGTHIVYTVQFDNVNLISANPEVAFQTVYEAANTDEVKAAIPAADEPASWAGGAAPTNAANIVTYFTNCFNALSKVVYTPKTTLAGINSARERQKGLNFSEAGTSISNINQVLLDIATKYPGNMPLEGDVTVEAALAYVDGQLTCNIALIQVVDGERTVLENHVGGLVPNQIVDGKDYYINSVLKNNSEYLACNFDATEAEAVKAMGTELEMSFTFMNADQKISDIKESELQAAYQGYFGNCEMSKSTILIPTYESENLNNTVVQCAAKTMDRIAIVGYPTNMPYDFKSIKEFYTTLVAEKFGLFYQGRDAITINGVSKASSCVGRIAGRYVATTVDAGINQIPSAESYGKYPAGITATLTSQEVLDLHELGVNSVYSTSNGAYIWGVKTMHSRQSSYFAKANVVRVIANVLYTTFPYLYGLLHTPNTDRKKRMVEANRQSFIDTLISQEVLRADSKAQCNEENNKDWDTNGGEILILDFDLGFIKLIERFKIRIRATDSTVTAQEV